MLLECFGKIGEFRAVKLLRAFLQSGFFLALLVLLMVCANLFSLELPVFYIYFVFGVAIALFDDDLLLFLPVFLCCYLSISAVNNPVSSDSAFHDPNFILQLVFIILAMSVLMIARLIVVLMRGKKKKVPALAVGFGALGLAYVLAGAFSNYYDLRTVLFGFTQIVSLSGLYFLFYFGVDWEKRPKENFALLFSLLGVGLVIEVFGMYYHTGEFAAFLHGGSVDRGKLFTGWGMYNNVGCALAMCAPAPFYLAVTKKRGYLYVLLAVFLFGGVVLTQSRGSMLFGGIAFLVGLVAMIAASKGIVRVKNAAAAGGVAAVLIIVLCVLLCIPAFGGAVKELFSDVFSKGIDDNGRFEIYLNGFEQFKKAPFFGVGFYRCTAPQWGQDIIPQDFFLPPRYHDTYVQLLASGGIFALACYLLHRAETVALFFRNVTLEKIFIAVSIFSLILTSFTDCHFFNFGPGLFYGAMLAYAEGYTEKSEAEARA